VDLANGDPNLSPGFVGRLETLDTMWIVRAGVNYKFGANDKLRRALQARRHQSAAFFSTPSHLPLR
jgi:hypothetical protein